MAAVLTVGCGKKDGNAVWWQGEHERIELSQQLALKQFRFEQLGSNDLPELERLRRTNQTLDQTLKSLKLRHLASKEEYESWQGQLAGFREATLRDQRNRAIGQKFAELFTLSGRTYREVTIASIDDAGVGIRHADGSARLRYQDLDSGQQLFFGLEADLAIAAAERESQAAADYERWIDEQMLVRREQEENAMELARQHDQIAKTNRSMIAARQTVAANVSPLARPAASVGSDYSYTRYRRYRPTYRYYYTPTYYTPYHCVPRSYITRYPSIRPNTGRNMAPTVSPSRKSFVQAFTNTTIPSIP